MAIRAGNGSAEPIVVAFRHGPFWNFSYLVACSETREAAVIDPAWDVDAILAAARLREFQITTVLATHSHSDHVNGVRGVCESTSAMVVAHRSETAGLRAHFDGIVEALSGETQIRVGRLTVGVLPTPGHSEGSLSFVIGNYVFTGDALNLAGPGTPGPGQGTVEALWESTQLLRSLPDTTRIHPGHDSGPVPHALLGDEKTTNPAFLADSFETFLATVERATGRRHRD